MKFIPENNVSMLEEIKVINDRIVNRYFGFDSFSIDNPDENSPIFKGWLTDKLYAENDANDIQDLTKIEDNLNYQVTNNNDKDGNLKYSLFKVQVLNSKLKFIKQQREEYQKIADKGDNKFLSDYFKSVTVESIKNLVEKKKETESEDSKVIGNPPKDTDLRYVKFNQETKQYEWENGLERLNYVTDKYNREKKHYDSIDNRAVQLLSAKIDLYFDSRYDKAENLGDAENPLDALKEFYNLVNANSVCIVDDIDLYSNQIDYINKVLIGIKKPKETDLRIKKVYEDLLNLGKEQLKKYPDYVRKAEIKYKETSEEIEKVNNAKLASGKTVYEENSEMISSFVEIYSKLDDGSLKPTEEQQKKLMEIYNKFSINNRASFKKGYGVNIDDVFKKPLTESEVIEIAEHPAVVKQLFSVALGMVYENNGEPITLTGAQRMKLLDDLTNISKCKLKNTAIQIKNENASEKVSAATQENTNGE